MTVLLSIGEMAKMNNVTKQTLRHYEREKLLIPAVTDPDTGYRYYTIVQSAKLDLIQRLKFYGMTLEEIRDSLNKKSEEVFQLQLGQKLIECDRISAEIDARRRAIRNSMENNVRYRTLPKDGSAYLSYKEERYLYIYQTEQDYFNSGYENYEKVLRHLKSKLQSINIPWLCLMKPGTIIRQEALNKKELHSHELFILVDHTDKTNGYVAIPSTICYCTCCIGYDNEQESCQRLLTKIQHQGYQIAGDCLIERIIDFPNYNDDRRDAFSEIQIPIKLR